MKFIKSYVITIVLLSTIIFPTSTYAIDCNLGSPENPGVPTVEQLICPVARLLNAAMLLAGVALAIMIAFGAIKMALSFGDPKGYQASTRTLIFALIGFLIVIGALTILTIINRTFGLNLGLNIVDTVNNGWVSFIEFLAEFQ